MIKLNPIERTAGLTKADFTENYAKPSKPVILTDFTKNWAAATQWDYSYFKEVVGDINVPLFAEAFADKGNSYMKAQNTMQFRDYLDLLNTSETKLRMFLFNVYTKMPALCNDFDYPDITDGYLKKYPFLFFGQAGSKVDMHYDADLSHVFISQFLGRKRIVLFSPDYSTHLYHHPFTVSCNIDISQPNFNQYPLLAKAEGLECILQPNETLFMPSGYWHYIEYLDTGFSLSLRAQASSISRRLIGYKNIVNLMVWDNILNKVFSAKRWYQIKEKLAVARANKHAK